MTPDWDRWSDAWWDATRERRLLVQACMTCGSWQHPPRPLCLACGGTDLAWREPAGTAVIDAWTTVHRSPGPGFEPPYAVARVRLTEGPILLTHLTGPTYPTGAAPHRCGEPVRLGWRPLADGRQLPVFDPMED